MQLYHGTHLSIKQDKYFVDIPENIIATSDFKKYGSLNVYLYVPKKENGFYLTDEIQVCITPLSFQEIEKLYFFELTMENIPGAFSTFLELFKEKDINILECRAIDSVYERQGKVELIATINNEELVDERKIPSLERILNKFYKEKLNISATKFKPIVLKKPIDEHFVRRYNTKGNSKDINKITLNEGYFGKSFPIELPNSVLKETIKDKKPFLGITYVSEGNYILVKFKSISEIIVPIEVTFSTNKPGALDKIITPLGDIGVNLRLILPVDLEFPLVYKIYFNIENTKLKLFDENTIERIIEEHIQINDIENEIKIKIDKDFFKTKNKKSLTSNFIQESNDAFLKHLLSLIKNKWLKDLSKCNASCNLNNCELNLEWSKVKEELANLSEQILNSKIPLQIPAKIIDIRKSRSKKCVLQSDLQVFYQNILDYINQNSKEVNNKSEQKINDNLTEKSTSKRVNPKRKIQK